jgi:hypothetical protein
MSMIAQLCFQFYPSFERHLKCHMHNVNCNVSLKEHVCKCSSNREMFCFKFESTLKGLLRMQLIANSNFYFSF